MAQLINMRCTILLVLLHIAIFRSTDAEIRFENQNIASKDALEGETIRLECRFSPQLDTNPKQLIYYWHRKNNQRTEPVAIGHNSLDSDYQVEFEPNDGRFDLMIQRAQYDRDNGQFECKIKESGSGTEVKSRTYLVTILIPPGSPIITPNNPIAKEGELFRLACSSEGGSPDPVIQWYRNGVMLEGELSYGGTRNKPTTNTLVIKPTLELDGANYKCTVWNRATREERKLESTVSLTVHYKPRITVGPYNPLSVSNDGNAEMSCHVEANPPIRSVKWMKGGHIIATTNNHTILRVKPEDSGLYDCVADNGIGTSKESLRLAVLHGPQISMDTFKEATTGESVSVACNVVSNPQPHTIIWTKENDATFRQTGPLLKFSAITPDDIGYYVCSATATLKPSGAINGIERTSNATVQLQIQHKPGKTEISPGNPVAVAGRTFTLSCGANPPGYPTPEYEWWKEEKKPGMEIQKLGKRANYTFVGLHVSHEGRYFCQPSNSMGKGTIASVYLSVNEPASVAIAMKPQFVAKEGDTNFKLTCIGKGKPRPQVIWTHNEERINPESGEYRIENKDQNEDAVVKTVESTLYFEAMARKGANSLTANDRGTYACHFDNQIDVSAKSETVLRVEHTPVVRHTYNRVAFDVSETAVLQCKMSAFPAPKFEWFFSGKLLENYDRYGTNSTELPDDIHLGTLSIRNTRESDYGDYTCRASNSAGDDDEKTIIKLVKKSAPETPIQLEVLEVVSDSAILRWAEGFNGGFSNTEFIVNYNDGEKSRNESCRALNPCKITGLESRREYQFRVLAVNPRGYSQYSEPLKVVTKVNLKDMPSAFDSSYDRERNILVFHVETNDVSLRLVAKIEIRSEATHQWTPLTNVQVLSDLENVYLKSTPEQITDIRVILCLQSNDSWCGYEHLVKMDAAHIREPKAVTDHLVGVVIVSAICALLAVVLILCCCWKKKDKPEKKDFESDTSNDSRPGKTIGQNFYSSHDNKGLMSDMDTANMNKLASGIYGSTMGPMVGGHMPQNYYLTENGNSDPSPNGSNETGQTEFWNSMKSNMLHDNMNETDINYNGGYNVMNSQMFDPNSYMNSYSYYPTQGYQPLDEENLNRKNNLNMSYYDEMNGNAHYGGTIPIDMIHSNEAMKANQMYNGGGGGGGVGGDEVDYSTSRARVMSEIIV